VEYGYFSEDNREYIVTEFQTPRPWMNYLSNDTYCVIVSQTGAGFSFYRAAHAFKVTFAIDDGYVPRFPVTGRFVWVHDRDNRACWTVNAQPHEEGVRAFRCRHNLGYTIFESVRDGIEQSLRIFVPLEDPVELWTVRVKNTGDAPRRLRVFPYVEWHLSSYPGTLCDPYVHALGEYLEDIQAVHSWNTNPENLIRYGGFMAADASISGFDTVKDAFLGGYGRTLYPDAVVRGACGSSVANAEKMVGALSVDVDLAPGEEKTRNFCLGVAYTGDEVRTLVGRHLGRCGGERPTGGTALVEEAFERVEASWRECVDRLTCRTPSRKFDRLVNVWVKKHVTNTARWTRGLDRGYRDMLQDIMGVCCLDPKFTRRYLLQTLRYQSADGTAMRQWSEIGGPHDLRNYKDSPVWIPDALEAYLSETGELGLLDVSVPYFDVGEGTVLDHAMRGVETLWNERGRHDLCLMGHGDWNDALNQIGRRGEGESVWLTCAAVYGTRIVARILERIGRAQEAAELMRRADVLGEAVNATAWDGDWYVYAFNDDGEPVGSRANEEGQCHLNVQSWALFTGIAQGERRERCLHTIDEVLETDVGPVLIYPPYTHYNSKIGRITAMNPGMFENGSVYCHGAVFKAFADCILGRGARAFETLMKIQPSNPKNPPDRSTMEPYGVTNFFAGPSNPKFGRSLYSFMTGSPAWTIRIAGERILGLRPEIDGLRIDPCVPGDWGEWEASRVWRGAHYAARFRNPDGVEIGVAEVKLDGKRLSGTLVPPQSDGEHTLEVTLGKTDG